MTKTINILGATGSVGTQTADVILAHPGAFKVRVMSAHRRADILGDLAEKLTPEHIVIEDQEGYLSLTERFKDTRTQVHMGRNALLDLAQLDVDCTVAAIVGMAGLEPILNAIKGSATVAIANKEPLVAAGPLVRSAARNHGCILLPLDSEHNAIFQVFDVNQKDNISRILLTASGGPFLKLSKEEMGRVTPQQAVRHPNWSMGAKISVDSATMMNKALELIEAVELFDMPPEKIDILIHPQSIIHSMVEYTDGSVLAQMGAPDMRTPISYCLGWPDRITTPGQRLDFSTLSALEFNEPDTDRFPALRVARDVIDADLWARIVFNAANEVAVAAFLNNQIGFTNIVACVESTLERGQKTLSACEMDTLSAIVTADESARALARRFLAVKTA